ncbi:WXG100 family type VII secretion target [Streptomyces sp. NBC_00433]
MTESWIGGDISGLQTMGSTLTGAKELLEGVVKPLTDGIETLVTDAGWKGEAAEEFRARWAEDAMAAGGFAELVKAAGDALTTLAQALSDADSALQNAADVATSKGVPVGPTGVPGLMTTAGTPSPADQKTLDDLHEYTGVHDEITHQAQAARIACAKTLNALYDAIDPDKPMSKGDKIVVADYLRGLWSAEVDGERKLGLESKKLLAEAETRHDQALAAMKDEEAKFRTAEADLPKAFRLRGQYERIGTQLDALHADVARSENTSFLPYDKALNYKLADALKTTRLVDGAPEFLRELPVLDIAASTTIGVLEAKEDHDKGWSWSHSLAVDVGAGLVGLGVGAAAAVALPEEVGAVAEAAVNGATVITASYLVDEAWHEHWSEDIHDHGVVAGIGDGTANVVKHTGTDLKDLGVSTAHSVGNAGKKVWHGLGLG